MTISFGMISGGVTHSLRAQESAASPTLVVQTGSQAVTSVAISKDGKYVLTAGGTNLILWETLTGRIVGRYQHHQDVLRARIHPESTGGVGLLARDKPDRSRHRKAVQALSLTCAPLTRDGKLSVAGDFSGKLSLVDANTLKAIRTYRELGDAHQNHSVYAISPDGAIVAAGQRDHSIQLFEVGGKKLKPLVGHTDVLSSFQFSSDGTQGVSVSADNTVRLWNIADAKEVNRLEGEGVVHDAPAVISPDGKAIAVARAGGTDLWYAHANEIPVRIQTHRGPRAFSDDGRFLVVGKHAQEPGAILYDLQAKKIVQRFESNNSPVSSISFSPDSGRLLFRNARGGVVWDLIQGKESLRIPRPNTPDSGNTTFVGDGKRILISGDGVQMVDANEGKILAQTTHIAWYMAWSPDQKHVAGRHRADPNEVLAVWDWGNQREAFRTQLKARLANVAYAPDGKRLFACTPSGVICYDAMTLKEVWNESTSGNGLNQQVVPSPDSRRLLLCKDRNGGRAELRDTATGEMVHRFEGIHGVAGAFTQDGKQVLVCGGETAAVFDATNFKEVRRWTWQSDPVRAVAIAPNGKWAATGGIDGVIRLWDVANGTLLCT
ncbi:MAG: WD40 repeat domain-containing protein [Gemmataceae bacterium]